MRDFILVYINGERRELKGDDVFLSLSDFLRERAGLSGTKVVCSEGDCGACTVLRASPQQSEFKFKSINSCITFMYLLDGCHLLTVEGLLENDRPSEIQYQMVENNGSQCGFCTPGFVMALAGLFEEKKKIGEQQIKNALTGNLCRCTGYAPIIDAGLSVRPKEVASLVKRYLTNECLADLLEIRKTPVAVELRGVTFFSPVSLKDAVDWKVKNKKAKIMGAGTGLGVLVNKNKWNPTQILFLTHKKLLKLEHESL